MPLTTVWAVAIRARTGRVRQRLRAAAELGFATAFVARPLEYGDPALADTAFSDEFDLNATDCDDLATQLGA